MAVQVIPLGIIPDGTLEFNGANAILIDSTLIEGGAVGYLRYIRFSGNDIQIRLSSGPSSNIDLLGPRFSTLVESGYATALTWERGVGGDSVSIPGPAHSSNSFVDPSEPYFWSPPDNRATLWRNRNLGNEANLIIDDGIRAPTINLSGSIDVTIELTGSLLVQNFIALSGSLSEEIVISENGFRVSQPSNFIGSLSEEIVISENGFRVSQPSNLEGSLELTVSLVGSLTVSNPVKVDPIYLLPEFPLNSVATMPLLHIDDSSGSRQRGDFSSSVDFTGITAMNDYQLFIYISEIPSVGSMFTIGTGHVDAISVESTGIGLQVSGQIEPWNVSLGEGPFILLVENANEGSNFIDRISLLSARTGITLHTSMLIGLPPIIVQTSVNWENAGVTHIYFNSQVDGERKFSAIYASATKFRFNSLYFIPITAKIIRGRDSQRQLTPPRVPSLDCSIWDFDGSIYLDRPYSSGAGVSLFAMLPSGEQRLMFTGVIDTVGYKHSNSVFTFTINALGMTSKLIRDKLYGEILPNVTLAQCIRTTLSKSSWPSDAIQLNDLEFATILSYWWLEGDSGWDSIQRLVNTEGPPSVFYEDNFGELVFLGTGRTVATITDSQTVGIAIEQDERVPIPVIGSVKEKSETKYVINHADMDVIEYITPDEDEDVWLRKGEFRILPLSSYDIRASFGGPLLNYANAEKPDFEATTEDLVVSYTDKSATRAIIHFENNTNRIIRVRDVKIQGRVLKIGSRVQVSSDSMDDAAITKSQDDHGLREWPGRVYNTITEFAGEQLVNNIVGSYHLGVETFSLSLYGNMPDALSTMLRFEETFSIRTPSPEGAQISDVQQPVDLSKINNAAYIRKLIHEWSGGFYTLGIETESRSMQFYGVPPYIIGVSLLGGVRGFSA